VFGGPDTADVPESAFKVAGFGELGVFAHGFGLAKPFAGGAVFGWSGPARTGRRGCRGRVGFGVRARAKLWVRGSARFRVQRR